MSTYTLVGLGHNHTGRHVRCSRCLFQIAVLDEDTGEMRSNFSYDVNERVVKITTEGTCKAVYGIEQVSQIVKQAAQSGSLSNKPVVKHHIFTLLGDPDRDEGFKRHRRALSQSPGTQPGRCIQPPHGGATPQHDAAG